MALGKELQAAEHSVQAKRKGRVVLLKPAASVVPMPARANHNTPRAIRVRVARSPMGMRKRVPRAAVGEAISPTGQQVVRSPTGKEAVGPWLGPFEKHHSGELDQETIFVDVKGVTYFDLGESARLVRDAAMRMHEAAKADDELAVEERHMSALALRAQARASLRRQARREKPRGAARRANVKQLRMIQQPRRN